MIWKLICLIESMITKGVASVRSPVCNLQQFSQQFLMKRSLTQSFEHSRRNITSTRRWVYSCFIGRNMHAKVVEAIRAQEDEGIRTLSIFAKAWLNCLYVLNIHTACCPAGNTHTQSWDWAYGQTPEFTYGIKKSFRMGRYGQSYLLLSVGIFG